MVLFSNDHNIVSSLISRCQNKVSKGAKIRNRYNQVPHLTQDTNEKVTNPKLDTTDESQEVSPFPTSYEIPGSLSSND